VVDLSILFFSYGRMWDMTRDAARDMSLGRIEATTEALQTEVDRRLGALFTATVSSTGQVHTVVVESPTSQLSPFGFLSPVTNNMIATVVISSEPSI